MKFKLISILAILFCLCFFNSTYADENYEFDSKKWTFKMLTCPSDQNSDVKVSKYYNYYNDTQYAFCIEPNQKYMPVGSNYLTNKYYNEKIFDIVKAYDAIGKEDDDFFIAAQILIWKEIDGIDYTFDGENYSDYKDKLIEYMNPKSPLLKTINRIPESYLGEEGVIDHDYSDYDIVSEGVDIISNDENGIKYIIDEKEPEIKTLQLTPKENDEDSSYVFESEESQDLYYHDGPYNNKKSLTLNLKTLYRPTSFDLYYSKVDTNDRPIAGAEFSVYKIDENSDDEIIFIQNNKDIDIFEAILGDYSMYLDLSIETTERFDRYILGNTINTKEMGYFSYKIYDSASVIKQGIVYVTNDTNITNNSYNRIKTKAIFKDFSEDLDINSINNLDINSKYYLCESEPKKGYEYASEPCVLVDPTIYDGTVYKFINSYRKYTLRLMKQSPDNILLDGAKFKITYDNYGIKENIEFTTGSLLINRKDASKHLIYKHESDTNAIVVEPGSSIFEDKTPKEGKYYYYESDSPIVNDSLLNYDFVNVVKGGFVIDDLPYSSSLTIEELVAPKGFIITEPVYHISPDISYSEIVFKNYRVNTVDIIPKKFKFPKTCING